MKLAPVKLLNARAVAAAGAIGLLLALASCGVTSTEWLHESTWDPDHPQHLSNYRSVMVWGWPLYWAIDHPLQRRERRIDVPGELLPWRLVADVVFYTLLLLYLRGLAAVIRRRVVASQRLAATLLSPLTAFVVVQLSFPLLGPSTGSGGESFLRDSVVALVAGVLALAVVFLVGLPVVWLLRRLGRFRPSVVSAVGALLAALPFARDALTTPAPTLHALPLLLVAAAAGGLCALTFWAFSGLGPSRGDVRPRSQA